MRLSHSQKQKNSTQLTRKGPCSPGQRRPDDWFPAAGPAFRSEEEGGRKEKKICLVYRRGKGGVCVCSNPAFALTTGRCATVHPGRFTTRSPTKKYV